MNASFLVVCSLGSTFIGLNLVKRISEADHKKISEADHSCKICSGSPASLCRRSMQEKMDAAAAHPPHFLKNNSYVYIT
jgi:hypothetical protein